MDALPHLVAVNVGRPAPLRIGDRVVRSGIVKDPAAGPVAVGSSGLAGDEQADRVNHGGPYKAAYAYAREDAAWWEKQIGRPLGPGAFGENLTLAGVDVTGARIGERWRIGSAEFEVSGPRVPCSKLGARMGDQRFPQRFVAAGRPGAYLPVVAPGTLEAGGRIAGDRAGRRSGRRGRPARPRRHRRPGLRDRAARPRAARRARPRARRYEPRALDLALPRRLGSTY
jgi:MOSC domain-containing protein YiiM